MGRINETPFPIEFHGRKLKLFQGFTTNVLVKLFRKAALVYGVLQ